MPVTVFSKPNQFLILKIVTLNVLMPAFSTVFSKCVVPDSENWDSKCSHTGLFSTVFSKCIVPDSENWDSKCSHADIFQRRFQSVA